ncbi:MafI family immunity protein [Pseudomonas chlororaphis]|uniref:MafI family immunity protein n=1 Tax=Pseudomonas chlororaphis TaxID=587753 RepID=UPI0023662298|nr:MafI family immunity protein [Pseudomonas chlororaphis]WDH25750.1 MafI family immunity protein [Pseudomonas chlororaphis]
MGHQSNDLRADFIDVLDEVSMLMFSEYEQLGVVPDNHALAQVGLENGREIVLDYVDHGEAGIAFEHLCYMIKEPPLIISEHCRAALARIAKTLEMPFTG